MSTIVDEIIGIGKKCSRFGVRDVVTSSIFLKQQSKLAKVIRQVNYFLKDK